MNESLPTFIHSFKVLIQKKLGILLQIPNFHKSFKNNGY